MQIRKLFNKLERFGIRLHVKTFTILAAHAHFNYFHIYFLSSVVCYLLLLAVSYLTSTSESFILLMARNRIYVIKNKTKQLKPKVS